MRYTCKVNWAIPCDALSVYFSVSENRFEIVLGLYDIFTQDEGQPETYFVSEITMVPQVLRLYFSHKFIPSFYKQNKGFHISDHNF